MRVWPEFWQKNSALLFLAVADNINMIPKVKTWIVTTDNGTKVEILAPTRRLALLNFRFEVSLAAEIKTIGLKRKLA